MHLVRRSPVDADKLSRTIGHEGLLLLYHCMDINAIIEMVDWFSLRRFADAVLT